MALTYRSHPYAILLKDLRNNIVCTSKMRAQMGAIIAADEQSDVKITYHDNQQKLY